MRTFSRDNNIADVTARCQAQNMVVDQAAIILSSMLTYLVRHRQEHQMLLLLVRRYYYCALKHWQFGVIDVR